jgi:hypothetical protein
MTRFALLSLKGQAMSLLGPADSAGLDAPAHRESLWAYERPDLRNSLLSLLGLHEGVDLVPFRLGKLGIGSHECSFDWLIERDAAEPTSACLYDQPPKFALTSFLHDGLI